MENSFELKRQKLSMLINWQLFGRAEHATAWSICYIWYGTGLD